MMIEGPFSLSSCGVLSSLTEPLARAGISIFAISTFDTDYLLVKQQALRVAVEALTQAGHSVYSDIPV
jgi:hypothetical protein